MKFTDSKGREIEIECDVDAVASYNGKVIGQIQFDDRDERTILFHMYVDEEFQRAGIGTEMMRRAAEVHGKSFGKPQFSAYGGGDAGSEDYYTQEGAALIRSCIRQGILDDTEYREEFDDYLEEEPDQES